MNPEKFPVSAFPQCLDDRVKAHGMQLRDYFAAKAMQGMLAADIHACIEDIAGYAYDQADAMIEYRNK